MASFRDRLVDGHQILSISCEGDEPATQIDVVVHNPAIGAFAPVRPLAADSHHLSRWYSKSSRELFDQEKSITVSASADALLLRSSLHKRDNDTERFTLLGDRIINGEARWGNSTPQFGEVPFIDGYWEWLEDVLAWNKDVLNAAKIYDVVFASLFTYDRNTNLLSSFCELWCPSTNSIHVPIGEVSISLWDLRIASGLPINGTFYDEVVPSARELTSVNKNGVSLLPLSSRYLLLAYRKIYCASDTSNVTVHDWVKFWFKGDSGYKEPPPRVQKKRTGKPKIFNNPTGYIGEPGPRSKEIEKVFVDLGIETAVRKETNLAALLSCWLCVFVLPNKEMNLIRPGVFKVASMMARGEKFSLAVPVLASIYHGLREIASSSSPSKCGAMFPIHYVYGWLGYYYDSYFLPKTMKFKCAARMVKLAGEKKSKHFSSQEACDILKSITPSKLPFLALSKPTQMALSDSGEHADSWGNYLITTRSSYLTLHRGNEHIVEPYTPHRYARQFRFCQGIPEKLKEELSTATLEEICSLWESCTKLNTKAEFIIPSHACGGFVTKHYVEWWEGSSSNFCRDRLAHAKPNSPHAIQKKRTITILKSKVIRGVSPPLSKSKEREMTKEAAKEGEKVARFKLRTPLDIPAPIPKPTFAKALEPTGENRKRSAIVLSEGSSSDKDERHWKRPSRKGTSSDLLSKEIVTISDLGKMDFSLENIIDGLPETSNHLEVLGERLGNQFAPNDDSKGSVDGPTSFDLVVRRRQNPVSGIVHLPTPSKDHMSGQTAPSTVTVFNTGREISRARRSAALILDGSIKSAIGKTSIERLASLEPKLQEMYGEFMKLGIDCSPLQSQIEKYMQNISNFIMMKLDFASGVTLEVKTQKLEDINQCLTDALAVDAQEVQHAQELRFLLSGIDTRRSQLMKELELMDSEEKKLKSTIEGIDAGKAQKQHVVTTLEAERATLEATEVIELADMEVASNLEHLLKSELDEIQNLAWLA